MYVCLSTASVSAAARAAREILSSALALQARTRIPVQSNYFTPEDEGTDPTANDNTQQQDDDVISSDPDAGSDSDDTSEGDEIVSGSESDSEEGSQSSGSEGGSGLDGSDALSEE